MITVAACVSIVDLLLKLNSREEIVGQNRSSFIKQAEQKIDVGADLGGRGCDPR